jgi:predicted nucleotidyltransferase component of viral defense system
MIDKREILESASAFTLQPGVVEKDYILGWLLAGIYAHPELVDSWVFKGGTCLKKCFFETYRFSEDLDFTMRDETQLEDGFLKRVLGEVIAWVADQSGLVMLWINSYSNEEAFGEKIRALGERTRPRDL